MKRKSVSKRPGTVTPREREDAGYRAALHSMRSAVEGDVSGAIEAACEDAPYHLAPYRRRSHGREAAAIFEGIAAAVALNILATARPGQAGEMAIEVARLLVRKVEIMSCHGNA